MRIEFHFENRLVGTKIYSKVVDIKRVLRDFVKLLPKSNDYVFFYNNIEFAYYIKTGGFSINSAIKLDEDGIIFARRS